jgi:hypothetical protein
MMSHEKKIYADDIPERYLANSSTVQHIHPAKISFILLHRKTNSKQHLS